MTLHLDPQIAAALAQREDSTSTPSAGDLATHQRHVFALLTSVDTATGPWRPVAPVTVDVHHATRRDGSRMQIRVVRPSAAAHGVVLYLHGGGLTAGSAELFDPVTAAYATRTATTFVVPDYALAPERPWPAARHDTLDAWRWVEDTAALNGWDFDRAAVMGDSAGGALAVRLCQDLRDKRSAMPVRQVLVYPALSGAGTTGLPAAQPFFTWTAKDEETARLAVFGPAGARAGSIADALTGDLRGLPATYVEVGQLDLYHDACLRYAERLHQAAVDTELVVRPGTPHLFDLLAPHSQVAERAIRDRSRALEAL